MAGSGTSADDLWRRLSTISEAEVRSIARIERVPGARERAEVAYRAAGRTDRRAAGPRLAERGPIEVDDPCSLWTRFAWHFTDADWSSAEFVIDDALAVLRAADLLPADQVRAVAAPVLAILT